LCEKLQLPEKNKYILCVGELLPNKNQKMAIEAMRKLILEIPEAVLLIAGNGPQRDSLVNMIENYGLQNNVILLGYCTNLEEYQRICEFSVSCSKREGLPLNLVEAMLSGNPVVATKNRGHNELIQNTKNGFLIEINDSDCLANYIKIVFNDVKLKKELGLFAREYALKYSAESVIKELKQVYFQS
jgi:glycosyltransferase EpsD